MSIPTYEGLLASARFFSDRALRNYTDDDHRSVLMDAGTFVEHLSKALLIRENPAYLVESKPSFDHLLHLTGRGDRAPLTSAVRTIGARDAVLRVRKLANITTDQKELEHVLEVRNGTVHAGLLNDTRTRQLLAVALRYCDEVYDALGIEVAGRWGDHDSLVDTLVEASWDDVQHEVFRKTEAARARLRALMDQIPESEQAAVAAARQSVLAQSAYRVLAKTPGDGEDPRDTYVGEFVNCPACNHSGALVSGPLRMERELVKSRRYDEPDDVEITALWIEPERLQCAVCEIRLRSVDEVRHAGIPNRVEITENIRRFLSPWHDPGIPDDFYDEGPWALS